MSKILVVGLGFQGKRYIEYFQNKGDLVFGVCKTQKTKLFIEKKYNIEVSLKIEDFLKNDFNIVIIALPSYIQGEYILENIEFLKNIKKVVIEMPITKNDSILEKLKKYDNFYFFLEEYLGLLSVFLRKINYDINSLKIFLYINPNDNESIDNDIIHISNNFLGSGIENVDEKISIIKRKEYNCGDLNYEVKFLYKNKEIKYIFNNNGLYLDIDGKKIKSNWDFDKNLEKILNSDPSFKKLYFVK